MVKKRVSLLFGREDIESSPTELVYTHRRGDHWSPVGRSCAPNARHRLPPAVGLSESVGRTDCGGAERLARRIGCAHPMPCIGCPKVFEGVQRKLFSKSFLWRAPTAGLFRLSSVRIVFNLPAGRQYSKKRNGGDTHVKRMPERNDRIAHHRQPAV